MSSTPPVAAPSAATTCIQAEAARELVESRLAAGETVRLAVSGGSMLPTLRPGDRLVVARASFDPADAGSPRPRPGDLLLLRSPRGWTVHRLLSAAVTPAAATTKQPHDPLPAPLPAAQLLTKGDSRRTLDPPWPPSACVGVVHAVEYGGRRRDLTTPAARRSAAWLARLSQLEGRLNRSARPAGRLRAGLSRITHAALRLLAAPGGRRDARP